MADIETLRQLAKERRGGTMDEQIAAFRRHMQTVLDRWLIEALALRFTWDETSDAPRAEFELPSANGWILPGVDGHAGVLDLVDKRTPDLRSRIPFDDRREFLELLAGWL